MSGDGRAPRCMSHSIRMSALRCISRAKLSPPAPWFSPCDDVNYVTYIPANTYEGHFLQSCMAQHSEVSHHHDEDHWHRVSGRAQKQARRPCADPRAKVHTHVLKRKHGSVGPAGMN